jgi:hypothetical protein
MIPLSERSEKRGKSKGELISFYGFLCLSASLWLVNLWLIPSLLNEKAKQEFCVTIAFPNRV